MAKIEVIETATVRRRRYSRDEKQALLAECAQTSMSAVARRRSIARSLLQRWKTDHRELERSSAPIPSTFIRLEAAPERSPTSQTSSATIRIASKSGLSIELPAGIDLAQLAAFVRLLEGSDDA